MARNRIIKPEFWSDAKVGRLSLGARLLYIGMWNFADDYGTISASPRRLLGDIFENDESVTIEQVTGWISEIESQGMIIRYTAKDKDWYEIPKFSTHQKGFNKSERRNPENPARNVDYPACNDKTDACNTQATCMLNGNGNDNDNANVNENVNGNDNDRGNGSNEEQSKGALDPDAELFAKAIAITRENLVLTSERRMVLRDIRHNVNAGADKFLRAVKNMMKSNWPDKTVTYFTDKKWDAINRIDHFANSPPKGNGFDKSQPLAPLKPITSDTQKRVNYDTST